MDIVMAVLVCLLVGRSHGALKIVQPLPGHRVVIENETLTFTCVAFDKENPEVKPLGFDFFVTNNMGQKIPFTVVNKADYSITNRTEMNGRKLFASLLFKRVKSTDNSRYECKIRNTSVAYGFGITYVPYDSLPQITVSKNMTAKFGDEVSLVCNLTWTGNHFINLITIAWIKDGERIMVVPGPKEGQLRNIDVTVDKAEDGGHYTCKLSMLIYRFRTYNITRLITLKVKPRFHSYSKIIRVVRTKGEPVEFKCNATGNPITIVWKRKPRNEAKNITITMKASSYNESHYRITSDTPHQGFRLEIPQTDYTDRGVYYCCLATESSTSLVDKQCQRFSLRVKDPLGYLWPLIGIAIEAIVLFMILVVSKRSKKSDIQSQRSEQERVEFSYTSSTDDKEGRIRLRRQQTEATTALH